MNKTNTETYLKSSHQSPVFLYIRQKVFSAGDFVPRLRYFD